MLGPLQINFVPKQTFLCLWGNLCWKKNWFQVFLSCKAIWTFQYTQEKIKINDWLKRLELPVTHSPPKCQINQKVYFSSMKLVAMVSSKISVFYWNMFIFWSEDTRTMQKFFNNIWQVHSESQTVSDIH